MGASSSRSGESSGSSQILQVNDSLYELYRPVGKPRILVLFFHGLVQDGDYYDAHRSTWLSEDGTCCWPQTWLVEELPEAHVFSVAYSGLQGNASTETFDMFLITENLLTDILQTIGQESHCPVVLVGQSIGGLIIKDLCCQAYGRVSTSQGIQKTRPKNFLNNLRGVFYYATPHHGSLVAEQLTDIKGSPMFKYFKLLSTETARLDYVFKQMCKSYQKCQFANLGESLPTKLGLYGKLMVVTEASSRGDNFNIVENTDHFSICRPRNKKSKSFQKLKIFLYDIQMEEFQNQHHPDNFQRLPQAITGIGVQLQEVKSKLKDVKSLGLVGMVGVGKTTLAMALFNDLCLDFEYTCFVYRVKEGIGSVDKQVWNNVYYRGKKFGNGEPEWSKLRDKRLLVVLDDFAGDCDITQVLNNTSFESRFIVTSRDQDLLERSVDAVHDVQFLRAESARRLFMSHAFPSLEVAPATYTDLMDAIVKKCEGLPLSLEVFGQFLKKKHSVEDWRRTLDALDKAVAIRGFDERLWAKLRSSYEELGHVERKMFLDATTFFGRRWKWTLRDAKATWSEAYNSHTVNLHWQTLVDSCLVYHSEEHERIKVHEQLQILGRRIAAETSSEYECRVWDEESILARMQDEAQISDEDLKDWQGRDAEDVLGVSSPQLEVESPMGRLQEATSSQSTIFPLRRLNLGLQSFFASLLTQVVFLRLNCSSLESLPSYIGKLKAVRVLIFDVEDFDDSNTITHVPDEIGKLSRLEVLEFHGFGSLHKLPDTLSLLSRLRDLTLRSCTVLEALPESFGHLSMLGHLELTSCDNLHSLPKSFGLLSNLQHLELRNCGNLDSLPASIGHLSMLEQLELSSCDKFHSLPDSFGQLSMFRHLELKNCGNLHSLPDSLKQLFKLRHVEFSIDTDLFRSNLLVRLHARAMEKVKTSDYRGAVGELCASHEALDRDGRAFLLQERGIAKRLAGDFHGALEDLLVALEVYGEASTWGFSLYDCRKHLGFVKFLMGDVDGAQCDGEIAVQLGPYRAYSKILPCLGEEPVTYLHFRLKGSEQYEDMEMRSSHAQVMERVSAADFTTAIGIWDDSNTRVLGYDDQQFFLQERGILKRMMGDLSGSLEDLVTALHVSRKVSDGQGSAYDCWKHLGYVKFLLGDLDGAQRDGESALELGPCKADSKILPCLGEEPVTYLHFRLQGREQYEDMEIG